jgi:hypothetical protein
MVEGQHRERSHHRFARLTIVLAVFAAIGVILTVATFVLADMH